MCVLCLGQELVWRTFREVAERHLESGPPPGGLKELHGGAELWAFNTDFSLEFPQPLMPYTVLVGGLLSKPAKPLEQVSSLHSHIQMSKCPNPFVWLRFKWTSLPSLSWPFLLPLHLCIYILLSLILPQLCKCPFTHFLYYPFPNPLQDLELWISSFGEAGFIVVTLGSMVSSVSVERLLVELVAGFSRIPQGVLWRWKHYTIHTGIINNTFSFLPHRSHFWQRHKWGEGKYKYFSRIMERFFFFF